MRLSPSRIAAACLLATTALAWSASFPYRDARPGYAYRFPRDHFEHPEFRTEWWYYTGNLRSAAGKQFGFELVFFRQAKRRGESENRSAWRIDDLYVAHLALTDIGGKQFMPHKRLNRAGPGIAGASLEQRRIWNGNWSSKWDGERQTLEATAEEFRIRLNLSPSKPFVIHGEKGVSQKAGGEGKASHYVSFPRLRAEGSIEIGAARHDVSGTAWMDHEWFTQQLDASQAGWDWFSVQFDDGRDLMLFQLRRTDGSIDPHSAGTVIDASGKATHLARNQFTLEPIRLWTSPKTGTRYPVSWRIRVPSLGIALDLDAALDGQELVAGDWGGPNYWEGAVKFSGSSRGVGYLEMTGYDRPVGNLF
ncbi:MAG: lipocalin-like domain-containing protein [Bryobacteraceae bacterium]